MIFWGSLILLIGFFAIALVPARLKGVLSLSLVLLSSAGSSFFAFAALKGHPLELMLEASVPFGDIPLRLDALSAWFILLINFNMLTGGLYGINYMDTFRNQRANLSLHWIAFVLFHLSMLAVCVIQNGFAFLIAWEIMSLTSALLLLFEYMKPDTLKAALNYLIQMHVGVVFLTLGVIGLFVQTRSFDFIHLNQLEVSTVLPVFIAFSIGFAFKAGLIPLHTWLPHAHPAAPSHISGIMSGVMLKIGFYGLLRMILVFPLENSNHYLLVGWTLLGISTISGLYGIMQAIVQHNLKKLLAYSSIENIGVVGMGVGLGCIGLGMGNNFLAAAGFMSSLLHMLNHSLFKTMLFYAAGNIHHAVHTLRLEMLGGLFKPMPQTAVLFLVASLSISGFPPFNAFISEFLLYSGLYHGAIHTSTLTSITFLVTILALVMIGGLTMFCFAKVFGVIFLGTPRQTPVDSLPNQSFGLMLPLYLNGLFILAIGLFPVVFVNALNEPVHLFVRDFEMNANASFLPTLQHLSRAVILFLGLSTFLLLIRYWISSKKPLASSATWGCGYVGETSRMQYTGNSFSRMYRRLAAPILNVRRVVVEIDEIFPRHVEQYETHPEDRLEMYLIHKPILYVKQFLSVFRFLQNGNIQHYLLYGIAFLLFIGLLSLLKVI